MAYEPNMHAAARRHLEAADILFDGTRSDVAGYLYGIAAECAVKAMMLDDQMRPSSGNRRDDPFFAHFPELRTMLLDQQWGRRAAILRRFIDDPSFLQEWDTSMRYCKESDIQARWISRWKEQAHNIIACIGT